MGAMASCSWLSAPLRLELRITAKLAARKAVRAAAPDSAAENELWVAKARNEAVKDRALATTATRTVVWLVIWLKPFNTTNSPAY